MIDNGKYSTKIKLVGCPSTAAEPRKADQRVAATGEKKTNRLGKKMRRKCVALFSLD